MALSLCYRRDPPWRDVSSETGAAPGTEAATSGRCRDGRSCSTRTTGCSPAAAREVSVSFSEDRDRIAHRLARNRDHSVERTTQLFDQEDRRRDRQRTDHQRGDRSGAAWREQPEADEHRGKPGHQHHYEPRRNPAGDFSEGEPARLCHVLDDALGARLECPLRVVRGREREELRVERLERRSIGHGHARRGGPAACGEEWTYARGVPVTEQDRKS